MSGVASDQPAQTCTSTLVSKLATKAVLAVPQCFRVVDEHVSRLIVPPIADSQHRAVLGQSRACLDSKHKPMLTAYVTRDA